MIARKKPVALIVDDEEMVGKLLTFLLAKFGIDSVVVQDSRAFLKKLKEFKPDVCLIDLNIDQQGVGYQIIRAVRTVQGDEPVLLVISAELKEAAIAKAIQAGANDYITKPISRELLVNKLSRYIKTPELMEAQSALIPVPDGGVSAELKVDFEIRSVDEYGVILFGASLLAKGAALWMASSGLEAITRKKEGILVTIEDTWEEDGIYAMRAVFDPHDLELKTQIRNWVQANHQIDSES